MTFSSRSPSENEVNLPPNEINRHTNDTSLPRDERELPRRSARDLRRNEHQQAENAQQRVLSGDPSPNLSLSPPTGSYWSSVDELNERNRSYVTRNTNSEETDRTSSRGNDHVVFQSNTSKYHYKVFLSTHEQLLTAFSRPYYRLIQMHVDLSIFL